MSAQAGGEQPSEEQLRAAYEAELARVGAVEVMLQAAVSLLNIAALRLRPPQGQGQPERDLEQARDAIDGAGALVSVLERRVPQEVRPLRDALSQLQMAYAREAQAEQAAGPGGPGGAGDPGSQSGAGGSDDDPGAGGSGGEPGPGGSGGEPGPGGSGGQGAPGGGPAKPGEAGSGGDEAGRGPGPAESSGRLWVPGR